MTTLLWQPQNSKASQMGEFMIFAAEKQRQHFENYQQLYNWSIEHPALFWSALCDYFKITFDTEPLEILNAYSHMLDARWFSGATFNFAEKLLSRQDDHPVLISLNENGERHCISYKELYIQVASCAEGLKAIGVNSGDRVAAIMPNVPFTIIAMLATTSLGAIWSSCSPDFGAKAAIDRLGQVKPKVLFAADGHQYLGKKHDATDKIIEIMKEMTSLKQVVICPNIHTQQKFSSTTSVVYWDDFIKPATKCLFKSMPFAHPLYILFSSGTTGKPKCIAHGAGGTLLQHIKELALHTDIRADDNLFFYTTCGWMMWNWMVSVLALGATLTLYEGAPSYPDLGRLFEVIEKEQVTVFGTSAKFILSVEKAGISPRKQFTLSSLKTILSTGSPLLPKNYDFVYQQIKPDVQLSSISGGTDIVSCFALGNPLLPVYRGEIQCFGLGMAVNVFNETGKPIQEEHGELVCTKPFPSMPVCFWNDPEKIAYKHAYFERFNNVWAHGDFAEITKHNGLIIYGRSDAVLNPGGVRIGTAEIYRQVDKIPEVLESIVIGQKWQDDVRIVLFVKLRESTTLTEQLENIIRQTIKHNTSARHVPAKILQVADIPRTISGKLVEIAVRQVVQGEEVQNLQSLANPEALNYFKNRQELIT